MDDLLGIIQIKVNSSVFSKDPLSSELGKKILKQSILLIDEMGFESYTFKKLAKKLGTTESSIYRYFENKHHLLIYLISWYWGYIEYLMVFGCANIDDPVQKLHKVIDTLCSPVEMSSNDDFIAFNELSRIVISETPKAYLTKSVDKENKEGFFMAFKRPCHRLADIIGELNPDYKYPHSLASNVVEGVISQKFFDLHLKSLTDFDVDHRGLNEFYKDMVLKASARE